MQWKAAAENKENIIMRTLGNEGPFLVRTEVISAALVILNKEQRSEESQR